MVVQRFDTGKTMVFDAVLLLMSNNMLGVFKGLKVSKDDMVNQS